MSKKKSSLDWLVAARGYAMYGVYFGHLMASYFNQANAQNVMGVGRFIEPLVVPFFIILTGAAYQRGDLTFPRYAWLKFSQRMIPFYFFLLLVIPFHMLFPGEGKTATDFVRWLPMYIVAIPYLSWPTWFFAALFVGELFYYFIRPLASTKVRAMILLLLCYTLGWTYNHFVPQMPSLVGLLGMICMLQAALLFCTYFLAGMLIKSWMLKLTRAPWYKVLGLAVMFFALMTPGILLNSFSEPPEGHFRAILYNSFAPVLSAGQYGNYFWFLTSTLFGAGTLLCISRLIPVSRLMREAGNHSFILIGLNAIFHAVINRYIVEFFPPSQTSLFYNLGCIAVFSAISMLAALGVAIFLDKYLPQLTGRPMLDGPLLPAIYRKRKK